MKNLFFLFSAIMVLGLATSCQKEDIIPQYSLEAPQLSKTTDAGSFTPAAGPVVGTSPTGGIWEKWNFCGQDMIVLKEMDKSGQKYLSLFNASYYLKAKFQGIKFDQLPADAALSINNSFAGYTIGQTWQSIQPVNYYFLVESIEKPGIALMVDKAGTIICKGTN